MSAKQQDNDKKTKATSKTICLYPHQNEFVEKRANTLGSVSRYFQLLADYDRKHNILSPALKQLAEELEGENGGN